MIKIVLPYEASFRFRESNLLILIVNLDRESLSFFEIKFTYLKLQKLPRIIIINNSKYLKDMKNYGQRKIHLALIIRMVTHKLEQSE